MVTSMRKVQLFFPSFPQIRMSATAEGTFFRGPGDWPGCHLNEQTVLSAALFI
jgi:hypothetical protein